MANNKQTAIVIGSKNELKSLLDKEDVKNAIKALANKYMTAERITKLIMLAASRQPKLFKCTPRSFLDSCMKSAELGLDFGGATGQAYIVPFKNGALSNRFQQEVFECIFIPGYQGLIELVYRGGNATYVDAQLVYKKDEFYYNLGSEPNVRFQPCLDDDRGEVVCAFAVVRLKDSPYPKIEIMTKKELLAIKARSKAKDKGPWQTDEGEMMRKTVLRRTLKFIPKTPDIEQAIEADNQLFDFALPEASEQQEIGTEGLKKRLNENEVKVSDSAEHGTYELHSKPKKKTRKAKTEPQTTLEQSTEKPAQQTEQLYRCSAHDDFCDKALNKVELKENECEVVNDCLMCPECGMPAKPIEEFTEEATE